MGIPAVQSEDRGLVEGLRRGEAGAVEALVERYGGWVYRVAARMLNDRRDAEEVTQDVLMTAASKIGQFRGEAAFSSWLYRIAVNAACSRRRDRHARSEVPLDTVLPGFDEAGRHVEPVVDWSGVLGDPAVGCETREAVERAFADVPWDYRIVLVLRDVEGLTTEEAARTLGLSTTALKSRLHRARLFLRRRLGQLFAAEDLARAGRRGGGAPCQRTSVRSESADAG